MEYFEKKVRTAFEFFDYNKDGFVSREELIETADKICSLSNTNELERAETRKQWYKWADALFPDGPASREVFWERNKVNIVNNLDLTRKENELTYGNMFDRLDTNKDGYISPEEFRLYYKAFGYGEDYDIDKIFRTLDDNSDGLISRDEFVNAGVTYWSPNPGYEYFYNPTKK